MVDYKVYYKVNGRGCTWLTWDFGKEGLPADIGRRYTRGGCSFYDLSVFEAVRTMLSGIEGGMSEGDTIEFIAAWSPWSEELGYKQTYEDFIEEGQEGKEKEQLEEALTEAYFPAGAEKIEEYVENRIIHETCRYGAQGINRTVKPRRVGEFITNQDIRDIANRKSRGRRRR